MNHPTKIWDKLANRQGFGLLEVLIAALVLGIAIVGFAMMLSQSQVFTVMEGDSRVALYLAEQKLEALTALGIAGTPTGNKITTGCATSTEPCYSETVSAGSGQQTPASTQLDQQTFTRLTCVRIVQDDDPTLPADSLDPASWTCPLCTAATCTGNTQRLKVSVYPTASENSKFQASFVTLEAVSINLL